MRTTAVLAGGLGSRVAHLAGAGVPKALLAVNGIPFIDLKLAELRSWGANEIIMLVARGAAELQAHVGDGSRFGLRIHWVLDDPSFTGTGAAVIGALALLGDEFWVTYGDNLLDVPVARAEDLLDRSPDADVVMTVLRNDDRWDRSNLSVSDGLVVEYRKGAAPGTFHWIDYGMSLFRRRAFDGITAKGYLDLALVLQAAVARHAVRAVPVTRRFYEIGTESGLRETEAFLRGAR